MNIDDCMKARFAIAVSLALATIPNVGCRQNNNATLGKQQSLVEKQQCLLLAKTVADALVDKTLLTEIREGRTTNAIEILEFSIDSSIVQMAHSTNWDAATQQEISQTLSLLKQYRQKYPRKIEAITGEGAKLKQDRKITEEANDILEHVGSHP